MVPTKIPSVEGSRHTDSAKSSSSTTSGGFSLKYCERRASIFCGFFSDFVCFHLHSYFSRLLASHYLLFLVLSWIPFFLFTQFLPSSSIIPFALFLSLFSVLFLSFCLVSQSRSSSQTFLLPSFSSLSTCSLFLLGALILFPLLSIQFSSLCCSAQSFTQTRQQAQKMQWQKLIEVIICLMDGFVQARFLSRLLPVLNDKRENRWNIERYLEKIGGGYVPLSCSTLQTTHPCAMRKELS